MSEKRLWTIQGGPDLPVRRYASLSTRLRVVLLVIGLLVAVLGARARATVEYARQTGEPCATCHVRAEGGGELTPVGSAYARGGYQWPVPAGVQTYSPSNLARVLKMVAGYVHLAMAVIWFGTIFYIHIVIGPQQLTTGVPRREGTMGWIGIGTMTVTGIVLAVFRALEAGSVFSGTFGTVFIVKLILFGVMVTLALVATTVLTWRMRRARRQGSAPAAADRPITAETLPSFDGQDGARSIVAVEDTLYDVSQSHMWRGGVHVRRHQAGRDLSAALKDAPHGAEVLESMPVVGKLAQDPGGEARESSRARRVFIVLTYVNLVLVFGILLCVAWWKWGFSWTWGDRGEEPASSALSEASGDCIACHRENEFLDAQISEWSRSVHAGVGVGCYDCHGASLDHPDGMAHNGYTVSVLVTPQDCGRCHVLEAEQFASSRHAEGGDILESLDNVLGEEVEGLAAAVIGCQQCHGATVEVEQDGTLSPASWPNTGIGRINPDGSRGACSTCHTRHLFSVAVAREPDACGNCHLGPDHPQYEIYQESKHGIAFVANRAVMNLEAESWELGEDYTAAPTCVTCHMGAVPGLSRNHDVGLRIAWTLRPEVSTRLEEWEQRRDRMTGVCRQCHSPGFYDNFFTQFDDAVVLYNDKFAIPAGEIMQQLRAAGRLTDRQFDEEIEWTYFLLWHHEGRRARHGAAMMGPDYVQWHGFFEVADRFYNQFVPQAEALLPGVTQPFLEGEYHQWLESED